jgi:tetratricopeptide (TPR) repeat protein
MKKLLAVAFVLVMALPVFTDMSSLLEEAESLHDSENHMGVKELLLANLDTASTDAEKTELYWRLARALLNHGDEMEPQGAEKDALIAIFEEGEGYADKAIELDPENHEGYYWKSANIGRAGQVRGILNSLFAAKPMRKLLEETLTRNPEHADSYYILGQLYEQLPGFPLSFGNKDYAVSLGRKALMLHQRELDAGVEDEIDYDYWTEMAKHLYARDWDAAKREKEQQKKKRKQASAEGILDKSVLYEADISLQPVSDRREAMEMLDTAIDGLTALRDRTEAQERDLKEAKEVLADWES